jgi:insecticidal toxin complex protein TccC
LPKGGGALRGIGEQLDEDEFSGVASLSIPVATTAARGLEPSLALSYSSTAGNGPFGLGWDIALPSIARSTARRIPRYDDSDTFTFGGSKLVPLDQAPRVEKLDGRSYEVVGFAPRVQQSFDRIERWTDAGTREVFWRIRDRDNGLLELGRTAQARIADPDDPSRVFSWLLETELDAEGNCIAIDYRREDLAGVPDAIYEHGRVQTARRYVSRIRYANASPCTAPPPPDMDWHVEVVFDYGDYDPAPSNPDPYRAVRPWIARADAFSEYAAGFEIRTHRLCRGVLLFHRFDQLGPEPVLAHHTRLVHDETARCALLTRVDSIGYHCDPQRPPAQRYRTSALPPLELGYSEFEPLGHRFEPMRDTDGRRLPGVGEPPFYALADLHGEGVPGVLYRDGVSVLYRSPELGPGRDEVAYAPAREPLASPPALVAADGGARLVDLSGDGRLDLVVAAPAPGYYANRPDRRWGPFTPLEAVPTTLFDPGQDTVDLTGDGLGDLLRIGRRQLRWSPSRGRLGYGPAVVLAEEGLPKTDSAGPGCWVGFADMFGSGQEHLVRIRDGIVECWPNLGYGRFGERVLIGNAPALPNLDPARILIADVDGSGTADLLVIEHDRVRIHVNQSGNTLADPLELPLPVAVGSTAQVQAADVHGTGTEALVITAFEPPRHWSYDWSAAGKPYLLTTIRNSLGAETEISYTSSTRFYLEDKRAGRPWATTLPFPVQVVDRVVQRDLISDVTLTRSFNYHDGYFDPVEREFRGFGMVERADAEVFAAEPIVRDGTDPLHPPATLTRTWYHTGAWTEERRLDEAYARQYFQGDRDAYKMPGPAFDWNGFGEPDAATLRQAHAALHGTVLRSEVYGLDGSAAADVPYEVSAVRPLVRLLQPARDGHAAVLHVGQRESIDYDYERVASDPQVQHRYTLAIDAYGDTTLSASLAYPRRTGARDAIPEQLVPHLTVQRNSLLDVDRPAVLLLGIPWQVEVFEIEGIEVAPDGYVGFEEARAIVLAALTPPARGGPPPPVARRVSWERLYYAAEQGGEAPPGTIAPQALLLRTERAAFLASDLEAQFAPVLDGAELRALLQQRGPFQLDAANGYWWRPSPRGSFEGAAGFFAASGLAVPLGPKISYTYDASYLALVGARSEASGIVPHVTRATRFDYQAMVPVQAVDVNGNTSEVLVDPLAMVTVASHHGTENDKPVGFEPILGKDWPRPRDAAEMMADPGRFLGGAATFYFHDLLSFTGAARREDLAAAGGDVDAVWDALVERRLLTPEGVLLGAFRGLRRPAQLELPSRLAHLQEAVFARLSALPSGVPAHTVQLIAPTYPVGGRPASNDDIAIEIQYFDGFGRVVQDKRKVEPGPSLTLDAAGAPAVATDGALASTVTGERWVTSARVRYNDKGKPVRQYDPYFVDTWRYSAAEALDAIGRSYTLSYDALSRVVRVDTPKGFLRTQDYGAWSQTHADEDDTVLASAYYRAHIDDPELDRWEREALLKSALSSGTPTTSVFDNLGRAVRTIERNDGVVERDAFEPLGFTPAQSGAIVDELRTNGFLDARAALTIEYQPRAPGFDLHLSAPYAPYQAQIVQTLDAIRAAGTELVTRRAFDIAGNELWSTDPRLWAIWETEGKAGEPPRNFRTSYGMDGDALVIRSADGGIRRQLATAAGDAMFFTDARGFRFLTDYDAAARPTRVHVRGGDGTPLDRDVERKVYGDQLSPAGRLLPDPSAFNLIGAVLEVETAALSTLTPSYSLLGGPLHQTLTFRALTSAGESGPIGSRLEDESFERSCEYDALGRIVRSTDPGGNRLLASRHVSGELATLELVTAAGVRHPYVTSIAYDARGRRKTVEYLGGVVATSFEHDPATTVLKRIRSIRDDGQTLQDLRYYEDAAGNPTHVSDRAFAQLFGRFGPASPEADFTTDALYRLVAATGRQRVGYDAEDERKGGYGGLVVTLGSGPARLIEDVSLAFAPDAAGSIYWSAHVAGPRSWCRTLAVSDRSNRAISEQPSANAPPFAPPEDVQPATTIDRSFDANGNQIAVDGIDALRWDERNLLASAQVAGQVESYAYDATGTRVRRSIAGVEDVLYIGDLEVHRDLASGGVREVVRIVDAGQTVARLSQTLGAGPEESVLVLSDRLGSVVLELDDDGALVDYEEYLPFGGTAWAAAADPATLDRKRYRFADYERDRATGLYACGQRCYMPWLARWLSPDPAGAVDGLNLYGYVGANPVRYADVGGNVRVAIAGSTVDITPAQILGAVKAAGARLKQIYGALPLPAPTTPTKKRKRGVNTYTAARQGDLFALAFNPGLRGSGATLPLQPVTAYYLVHGTVDSAMGRLLREVGVHGTRTLKNADYATSGKGKGQFGMPGYPDTERPSTRNEVRAEARRVIRMMKVKEVPTGNSFNNRIVPVMAISENDRSEVGGLLAMIELYNVKYGQHAFYDAFAAKHPFFIGAEVGGGAKALKSIDRGETLIGRQQDKLDVSLTAFVEKLSEKGKFRDAATPDVALNMLTDLLVKRAGPAPAPAAASSSKGPATKKRRVDTD